MLFPVIKASHPLSRLISTSLDYHFKGVSRAKFMETLWVFFPIYRCEQSCHAVLERVRTSPVERRPVCRRKGKEGSLISQTLRDEGENSRGERTKAGKYPGAPSHGAV